MSGARSRLRVVGDARTVGLRGRFGGDARTPRGRVNDERELMSSVVISSSARTAIGSFGRSLVNVPPSELGATAARAAIARAGLEPDSVEEVVFGNVIHTAAEDMYLGRVVGMKAGIPKEVPAMTLNRLCGSGLQAILTAAQVIQTGDAEVAVAGGAESMSRGAYWMQNARWGARMGDASMVDTVVGCLTDPFNDIHMGVTAENLAESHGISRGPGRVRAGVASSCCHGAGGGQVRR